MMARSQVDGPVRAVHPPVGSADRPRPAARAVSALSRMVSFALFFLAWEIAGRVPISYAFPDLSPTTFAAFVAMLLDGSLPVAYVSTLQPLIIGVVISGVIGVVLGIVMGLSRTGGMARRAALHRAAGGADGSAHSADHLRVRHRPDWPRRSR